MSDYSQADDTLSSLERAREHLYARNAPEAERPMLSPTEDKSLPHAWSGVRRSLQRSGRHVRLAGLFFVGALLFFILALGAAAYFLYFGGNAVSVNNVSIEIQGPTTIAGGDTVPLSLTITNRNSVPIENATLEIDFPTGTRSADNVLQDYPRYTENLGTLASGATVTRSVKAVVFGSEGQSLSLPISLSYGTSGSSAVFVKKSPYALAISTTPLSVSVDAPTETVSGAPLTFTLTARSNASAPLTNVLLTAALPFGFTVASSSIPMQGSSFALGDLAPGESRTVRITGVLTGENASALVFRFGIGTASDANPSVLAVQYMEQDSSVTIAAPFISTTLAVNGDSSGSTVVAPGAEQNITLSYTNTLASAVTSASIEVKITGSSVDYASIQTNNGFYQSTTHSIIFDQDTDPSLASLAPGASGIGTFTFATLSSGTGVRDPLITFTTSVSGTRVGQTNVPETVEASSVATAKVATALSLVAKSLYSSGPLTNSGPIPPRAGLATTYSILWQIQNGGNAVAGNTVTATLPSYVTYTGKTSGGGITYDSASRTVSWNAGDLVAGASALAVFQVSLVPSSSQRGGAPALTGPASLSGFDRYAQVSVSAIAAPVTTETTGDPGYSPNSAAVQ